MSKKTLRVGDAVVTNALYASIMRNKEPVRGVLLKEVSWASGVWSVNMEGFSKPQRIHSSMLEVEK